MAVTTTAAAETVATTGTAAAGTGAAAAGATAADVGLAAAGTEVGGMAVDLGTTATMSYGAGAAETGFSLGGLATAAGIAGDVYSAIQKQDAAHTAASMAKERNNTELALQSLRARRQRNQQISEAMVAQDNALLMGVNQGTGSSGTSGVVSSVGAQFAGNQMDISNQMAGQSTEFIQGQKTASSASRAARTEQYNNIFKSVSLDAGDIFGNYPKAR